jgi:hypothetical protein
MLPFSRNRFDLVKKRNGHDARFRSAAVIIALFLFPQSMAWAQNTAPIETGTPAASIGYQPITDEDIQLMRKDIRSQRKQIIAANMKLNDAEAEKFWPVYNQYIADLSKINDSKYALIKQYVQNRGVLSDAEAEGAVNQWVGVDQSVAELRKKYIPTFHRVLSPKNTALFYQLDRRVQLLIDPQLAPSLPRIGP